MSDNEAWIRKALDRPERDEELIKKGKDIALYPLVGWSTGTLPQNGLLLGIEFLIPPPETSVRILRLAMTRAQCAELATVLERLARTPHVLPPNKPS